MTRLPALLALLTACTLASLPAHTFATTLSYGSPLPSTHVLNKNAIQPFLKRLEEKSDGDLSWRFYPGGTTAKLPAVMGSIRSGIVDSGYMIDSLTLAEQSYNVMVSRMGTFGKDPMVMAGVANELLLLECPQCTQQLTDQDIVPLAYVTTTPFLLICRDRYNNVEELKGKRFRSPGSYGEIASMLGAVPVNVPPTDTFEALQRGQADCTFGPEGHLTNYSLYEVTHYVIDYSFGMYISGSLFNMNKRTWTSLTDDERGLILDQLPHLVASGVRAYQQEADEARAIAKESGVTYMAAPPGVEAVTERYRANLIDSIDKDARARGIDDIRPILEKFQPLVSKWKALVEQIDHDPRKFEELLAREIYDHYRR
ncbi:hypothetical protein CEK62_07350 [Alcanivorax sp. N3-2A]|nr:hypothetical protein CEK62_07350 [Alcanivorax sp. N3-2A]|tara:strand:- start:19108 stop:20217 length:1110 start_codon:yes stop_codon:yes gene_type:complete